MTCTQGTMIYSVRSNKYPASRCYGIIITARCDIAQEKTAALHYLTGLEIADWIKTTLFSDLLDECKNEHLQPIQNWARDNNYDYESLLELGPDKAQTNIALEQNISKRKKLTAACEQWKKYNEIVPFRLTDDEKINLLNSDLKKGRANKLKLLFGNRLSGYCFVPKCAYSHNQSKVEGVVVDLKDMHSISIEDIKNIECQTYDYNILCHTEKDKLIKLNEIFFLAGPEDIVVFDHEIRPPWIEHLMQSFALSFIRIGLDSATNEEINSFSNMDIT